MDSKTERLRICVCARNKRNIYQQFSTEFVSQQISYQLVNEKKSTEMNV